MLRPWSTKRVPWSKPAEYIVTRPTRGEQQRRPAPAGRRSRNIGRDALPQRGLVEDGAHRTACRVRSAALGGDRGGAHGDRARCRRRRPWRRLGQRHVGGVARRADRRRRLALLRGGDVGSRSGTCRAARSRTRGARSAPPRRRRSRRSRRSTASAIVRLLERREGGVQRVVALALVDLAGVVLLVRA